MTNIGNDQNMSYGVTVKPLLLLQEWLLLLQLPSLIVAHAAAHSVSVMCITAIEDWVTPQCRVYAGKSPLTNPLCVTDLVMDSSVNPCVSGEVTPILTLQAKLLLKFHSTPQICFEEL